MTIKSKTEKPDRRPEIDLNGPEGNAFVLLAYAKQWARDLGIEDQWPEIHKDALSGDYENLLAVLDRVFGEYVTFYR